MTTEQNIAYQHFHTAVESLAEYKPRYQHPKNDHSSHMYLSNRLNSHTIPSVSAFGDEHLPYSPYYSSGISNNSCASSFTSISSSTSIASSDDFDPLIELRAFGKKAMKREKSSSKKTTCTMEPSLENPNDIIAYSEDIESKRDFYGFKLPTEWVSIEELYRFDRGYKPILERQASKWATFLAEAGNHLPPLCCKLKRYTRKGVPRHLRSSVWMHYSGAQAKMNADPGLYKRCLDMGKESNEHVQMIERDARRTFSENIYFSQPGASVDEEESNPKRRALKNVLVAFTTHLGFYHPSFATLAAFFVLIVDDEHKAFRLLEQVVLYYYPENAFNGRDLSIDQSVLMQLVYDKMPGVWNKLSNKRCFWECSSKKGQMPPVTVVTSHWFLDGFINILPIEAIVRIWDCIFIEGYQVLFRVALTIFKLNESHIHHAADDIQASRILQNTPRGLIDCDAFLEAVFSKTGVANEITFRDIERRRVVLRYR
ncbi:gtpase-activating protein gyp3 [Lichtheimia corymbifera JMRC:FSU:9682]|uniref:Gtpase-activating protein gyp3 n=1 Tax=Lichtheimia corymbifera JMRC:FSU:9682 TaxID=1263082 RepID=A0A068S4S5_9FUNG|nr:gtpase-activating protein gyp3 [Lichtheimia corymbifera JMRC:FSU:9682]